MGRVYKTSDEMIAAVSKETGLKPDDVRNVIRATFESTKAYILREAQEIELQQSRLREKIIGSIQL